MRPLWIIAAKEIHDNLRDTRSLLYSLLFGAVLLPALLLGPLIFQVNKHDVDAEHAEALPVAGAGHAPNLVRFLETRHLDAVEAETDYAARIRAGDLKLVLEIPPDFTDAFPAGEPAPLVIHYDSAGHDSKTLKNRLRSALEEYAARIQNLRYLARGLDERVFKPLDIAERDLADEDDRQIAIALMLPFLLFMAMIIGGFYLAVDITAGERERLSLEPLLALPVKRVTLVLGKYAATLVFLLASLTTALIVAFALFTFLSNEAFSNAYDLSARAFLIAGAIHLPAALMLGACLLFIAALARSTKEAQTLLSLAMLVPMLPFFVLQFMDIPRGLAAAATPVLGQYRIVEQVITGEAVPALYYGASIAGALAAALVFLRATVWLYSKESILQ